MGKKQCSGKGITAPQMRKIHACARECGMDDDLLHLAVKNLTGRESLKELTAKEACCVIDMMEGKQKAGAEGDAATAKQLCYIKDLMKKLGWVDEKAEPDMARLNGMCRKYAEADSYRWLSKTGAGNIIEALKKMLERRRAGISD